MANDAPGVGRRLRFVREILFSLNLGYALALVTTFLLVRRSWAHGATGSRDLFERVLLRVNLWFYHSAVLGPFGTDAVLTSFMLIFFLLLLLVLRLVARAGATSIVLNHVAGIAALAAVPLSWVFNKPTYTGVWVLALYFAVVGGALFLTRRRAKPAWFVVLIAHYSVCGYAVLRSSAPGGFEWPRYHLDLPSMWPYLLSPVSPCAGFAWALYVTRTPKQQVGRQ